MKCKFCQDIRQKIVSKDLNVAYEDEEHVRTNTIEILISHPPLLPLF